MRALADRARIERFLEALGRAATRDIRVYLVGGTTAVLLGWRATTIDVDLVMQPEDDALLRVIVELKESLQLNVELASPADFLPIPEGWEARSRFIRQLGRLAVYHYDLYAQAMAKVERGHRQDLEDVQEMIARGLVEPAKARAYFARMEPSLHRFPAIHPPALRAAVERAFGPPSKPGDTAMTQAGDRFRHNLFRVLAVQALSLLVLWLLQMRYHR